MINVTYAITVCNELQELITLVDFLQLHLHKDDEILIQYDEDGVTLEVLDYLKIKQSIHPSTINVIGFPLNNDFSSFKNNLKNHSKGIFIFQIDADELPHEYLISNIHNLLDYNKDVDLFFVPRVNTVDGITEEHIKKWRWPITKMETQIEEKIMDTDSDEYKLLKKLGYIIEETEI